MTGRLGNGRDIVQTVGDLACGDFVVMGDFAKGRDDWCYQLDCNQCL